MPTLKARIGGTWVNVGGGASEVEVSATDPIVANPAAEMWYDTADPGTSMQDIVGVQNGSYTPTLTSFGIGSGTGATNSATWQWVGQAGVGGRGLISIDGLAQFGATGSSFPTAAPTFALPAGFNFTARGSSMPGMAYLISSGVDVFVGFVNIASVTTWAIYSWVGTPATAPIYPRRSTPNATTPFTWKAQDQIYYSFTVAAVRV